MRRDQNFNSLAVQSAAQRLGDRVRTARKALKLSLSSLERSCHVHRQTLARLEQGDLGVSLGVALSVLEVLGELASIELVLSNPGKSAHHRPNQHLPLNRDF